MTAGDRPIVIPAADRVAPPAQQTPSMHREEAFAGEDRWMGLVTTTPGEWSGWHHHGDHDSYFYVLHGTLEFEYGADGSVVAMQAGDFAHVPRFLVHRERTVPPDPGQLVLVRFGSGPTVTNVEAPDA